MSFNELPETLALDPLAAEDVQCMTQERLARRREATKLGQLATHGQVEAMCSEALIDNHRSGNMYDWDQNVYGAD